MNKVGVVSLNCEENIISDWKYSDKVYVTFFCLVFNHEMYIEDTIKGFLLQKTKYKFEIFIHDDASTDKSLEKILKYKKLYPNIIRVVSQKENLYSKGIELMSPAIEKCKGEFIAYCEGDDYWDNPNKIQNQLECMLQYPSVDISFHSAKYLMPDGSIKLSKVYSSEVKSFLFSDVVLSGGAFMPSPSIMIKRSVFGSLKEILPITPVADYYIQLIGSINGAMYIPDISCVYRKNSVGSWSSKFRSTDSQKIINYVESHLKGHVFIFDKYDYLFEKYEDEMIAYVYFMGARMALDSNVFFLFRSYVDLCNKHGGVKNSSFHLLYQLRFFPRITKVLFNLFRN